MCAGYKSTLFGNSGNVASGAIAKLYRTESGVRDVLVAPCESSTSQVRRRDYKCNKIGRSRVIWDSRRTNTSQIQSAKEDAQENHGAIDRGMSESPAKRIIRGG